MQRLQNCSEEERKSFINELAKNGSDESVEGLIHLVSGVKKYDKSWKTLWLIRPVEYYNTVEQMKGIEALAETKNEKAVDYLKKLCDVKICIRTEVWEHEWPVGYDKTKGETCHNDELFSVSFPNASNKLNRHLSFSLEPKRYPIQEGSYDSCSDATYYNEKTTLKHVIKHHKIKEPYLDIYKRIIDAKEKIELAQRSLNE